MICSKCNVDKPRSDFKKRYKKCKECQKMERLERENNKEEVSASIDAIVEAETVSLNASDSAQEPVSSPEDVEPQEVEHLPSTGGSEPLDEENIDKVCVSAANRLNKHGLNGKAIREYQAKVREVSHTLNDKDIIRYAELLAVTLDPLLEKHKEDAQSKIDDLLRG